MAASETGQRIRRWSDFLDDWCKDNPERLDALVRAGRLNNGNAAIADMAPQPEDGTDFNKVLRAYRNESLAIIAWRNLAGVDDLGITLEAFSTLADRCSEAALCYAEQAIEARYGALRDADGHAQRLIVIGMGKLGGGELNFSSDIDLIFAYRRLGESDGERSLDADGYFKRVARAMIQCLGETTAGGFVYRVDTRLRPFGDAGALVASISAMENYYQAHGREWERYA